MTFKKGQSGNPGGRPKLPGDVKEARNLTNAEVIRVLSAFLQLSPQDLREKMNAPDVTMLEGLIGSIMLKGIKEGSPAHLSFLFDRTVGKVKDQLEVTTPTPFIVQRSDGSQVVMGSEVKKKEEG